jgi:hypothetical protein
MLNDSYDGHEAVPEWVGGKTYRTRAEAALHRSADEAEGLGALIYTDDMLRQRLKAAAKSKDVVLAHYQRGVSEARMEVENEADPEAFRIIAVYEVERLPRAGREGSEHEVELSHTEEGHHTATCGCKWYLEVRGESPDTVCVHILKAVAMHRLRTGQAMPELPPAEPRKRAAKTESADAQPAAAATRRRRKTGTAQPAA